MMRRMLICLLALSVALCFVGCEGPKTPSTPSTPNNPNPDPEPPTTHTLSMQQLLEGGALTQGRIGALEDGAISFDWSTNAISLRISRCSGDVTVALQVAMVEEYRTADDDERAEPAVAFMVEQNGVVTKESVLVYQKDGITEIKLAEDLPLGDYTFTLTRLSRIQNGAADLLDVTYTGDLVKMEGRVPVIEFIGDSITAGYGLVNTVDHPLAKNGYLSYYSDNACKAYAYLAAKQLGADYSMIALSGSGFAYGWNDYNLPDVYEKSSMLRGDITPLRDPLADIVVINLGTNDLGRWGYSNVDYVRDYTGQAAEDYFEERFVLLLNMIYDKHGDVPIVFVYGAMNDCGIDRIKNVMDEQFAWATYTTCPVTQNTDGNKGHPDTEAAALQGDELVAFLRDTYPGLFCE